MLNRVRHFAEQHPNLTTIAIILALFALAQLILGTQASPLATPQDLATQLTNGTPAVVEYFSNL
jgi:hypothetical protein